MSNCEHVFEAAINYIKSGKDFYSFKSDKNVAFYADGFVSKDIEDRAYIILDMLEGIWSIANYVNEYYVDKSYSCDTCNMQGVCHCKDCFYVKPTRECYTPKEE